ncbi:MAG TPA: circadian clock protein KaiC, partial [Candidatus Sulfotelmatobacter sp.]|nr:circadian clock protein KaiC [Candidatus Sulfotelmatobacter sp.]
MKQQTKKTQTKTGLSALEKAPTGIAGLDEVSGGGLPQGRPTLVCGSAGCGKTLLAMEFLVRGATQFNEPGVFMSFEEDEAELTRNVASLGFDLPGLVARKKLALDHVRIERSEIEETGEYDLEGLFIRLASAIEAIGAKRVVLDTIEALFASLPNEAILRSELRRLFRWLKGKGVTAIITGERGDGMLTRHGLEEYVADCVIVLDHRVIHQITTRRLRIVKYRGSLHGTNEYPFLITQTGLSVLPITSLGLAHPAPAQRVSTGVPRLDAMLDGKGYFRGSSILVSGTAGTGKTTLAAAFAQAACRRAERTLYFAFEESPDQIRRNMASVGIDLGPWAQQGLLHFHAVRPNLYGLEMHLLAIHDRVRELKPKIVIIDPITNLISVGEQLEVRSMLTRLIDFFKTEQITTVFTSLTAGDSAPEQTEVGVSSLMDVWILLRNLEHSGERNRALCVLKARGMAHSNQVREFQLSSRGIDLVDVYAGPGTVLAGAARLAQEARDAAEDSARAEQLARLRRAIERKQRAAEAQMAILRAETEAELE